MFLDYFALFLVFFVVVFFFYAIIVIHDIPYEIAVHRNHPHQDAIHVAGWVSLFTLHAIWPFLWIWSTFYREDRGWGFDHSRSRKDAAVPDNGETIQLVKQVEALSEQVEALQAEIKNDKPRQED
ncbi:MAG: DUF3302 domain-containing protein [Gammaproteobacteria bacterium]|nr:DUF3302 domain-containing protein [Gammaproteobacteria bacterium]